jgi:hypothetical protein
MTFSWKPIEVPAVDVSTAPQRNPLGAGNYFDQWKNTAQGRSLVNREIAYWKSTGRNAKDAKREAESRIRRDFKNTEFYKDYLNTYNKSYEKQYATWEESNKPALDIAEDIRKINLQGEELSQAYTTETAEQADYTNQISRINAELRAAQEAQKLKDTALVQKAKAQQVSTQNQLSIQQQVLANQNQLNSQKQRTSNVGAPKPTFTRVSRPSVGGYGGTAPGRINPTGLNI